MSGLFESPFIHLTQSFITVFRLLQKICLVDHIRQMADLLHADAIQQLEVALLGLPAAGSDRSPLRWIGTSKTGNQLQHQLNTHPPTYTSTPFAPPSASVPVVGVSESSHIPAMY